MGYRLRVWDERTLQRLAAAWRNGVTPRELAEQFGYTPRAIIWKLAQTAEAGRSRHTRRWSMAMKPTRR